jgi:hypothetical protein
MCSLPHLGPGDGIRDRDIELSYPGGTVKARPATDYQAPLPDPGEAFGNVNVASRSTTTGTSRGKGAVTPQTAPVINTLAREHAFFTHWYCEVPTCKTPSRNFFFCGTSQGRLDNEFIIDCGWDFEQPSICSILEDQGTERAGASHRQMWKSRSRTSAKFFADCAAGTLPAFSGVEPKNAVR